MPTPAPTLAPTGAPTPAPAPVTMTSTPAPTTATAVPTLAPTSMPSSCSGEPCDDASYCRSEWGYCGSSADHCNAQSTWKAGGCSGGASTTALPTLAPVPVTTASPTISCAKVKYDQCGGSYFTGDTCCPPAMWCMETAKWWAQCEPCAETWDASCAGAVALNQPPSLMKVRRKGAAPWHAADSVRYDEPARVFLAPKKHE